MQTGKAVSVTIVESHTRLKRESNSKFAEGEGDALLQLTSFGIMI